MPEPRSTFRDFGIIPDDLPPPAETVRSYLSGVRLFGQYLATVLVAAVGLGLAALMPLSMSLLACPAALAGFGVFIEIHFRGRQLPLRVIRSDPAMTNAKELIEAIVYRMQQSGEIDYEIVDFAGKPLLRKVFWKGQPQGAKAKGSPNVVPGCLMALALMFGTILAFRVAR